MEKIYRKKILLFTRPLAPPWDEASKNLAFEVAKNSSGEFEFHALTTKKYARELSVSANNFPAKKVVAEPIYKDVSMGKKEQLALLGRLVFLEKSTDIIHFLFTPRELTSFLIRKKLKFLKAKTIQTIATVRDELYQDKKSLKKVIFADFVVAQSFVTKEKLLKSGVENVTVIYPGIDLEKFSPTPKDFSFMDKLGLKRDDFVVLYAGEYARLEAMENIFGAIEHLLKNERSAPKIKFVMACRIKTAKDAVIKKAFVEKTKKAGYAKDIVYIDFCPEMVKLYNIADVQIFPVKKMAGKFDIPFVLLEQMACKKPVIISDLEVLKEFVKDQENGIVVGKNSPEQLAKVIWELSQNRQKIDRLGANAMEYVRNNFDIKENVKEYEKIYNEM